jgi:hypothetical protein
MNPDPAMADELLKKTGAANLFMVLGERDIGVGEVGDGLLQVDLCGSTRATRPPASSA